MTLPDGRTLRLGILLWAFALATAVVALGILASVQP